MNVATFIKALRKFPQDADLNFIVNGTGTYRLKEIKKEEVVIIEENDGNGRQQVIEYDPDIYIVLE